jgi:hypothetical protein
MLGAAVTEFLQHWPNWYLRLADDCNLIKIADQDLNVDCQQLRTARQAVHQQLLSAGSSARQRTAIAGAADGFINGKKVKPSLKVAGDDLWAAVQDEIDKISWECDALAGIIAHFLDVDQSLAGIIAIANQTWHIHP